MYQYTYQLSWSLALLEESELILSAACKSGPIHPQTVSCETSVAILTCSADATAVIQTGFLEDYELFYHLVPTRTEKETTQFLFIKLYH